MYMDLTHIILSSVVSSDEVCVLSASGTAAVIALYSGELSDGVSGLPNLHKPHIPNKDLMTSSLDRTDFERDKNSKHPDVANTVNIFNISICCPIRYSLTVISE